jgi:endonuclease/exonuclease/phosphatase family metal-dependent hydrolase
VVKAPKYRLQVSTTSSMAGATYHRYTGTTGTVSGLRAGKTYYVKVRVITSAGGNLSVYSSAVKAFTSLPTPSGLKVSSISGDSAALGWSKVTGAPHYRIQLAKTSTMSGATYFRFPATEGSVTGLEEGKTYYAKVRVITPDGVNLSNYSAAVRFNTQAKPTPLTIASWNVRCANCYAGTNTELPWSGRRDTVVQNIKSHLPDVIGIQEASQGWLTSGGKRIELSQFEDLRNRLRSAGTSYDVTDLDRNNCVKSTTPSSCTYKDQGASQGTKIFFNTATVEKVSSGSKRLPGCSGCNERYVAWGVFNQKATGQKFFLADAHLEPGGDKYTIRKSQAATMMAEVMAKNVDHLPAFVVGDFNSTRYFSPSNAPYDEVVSHGFLDPLGQTYKSPKISSLATVENRIRANYNSFSNFDRNVVKYGPDENGSNIDYVFTTPMRTLSWETVLNLDANDKQVGVIPSDHNMLLVKVLLP